MDQIIAEVEQMVRAQQDAIFESYREAMGRALQIPDERRRLERIATIDRDCRELCNKVAQPLAELLRLYVPPVIVHDPSVLS